MSEPMGHIDRMTLHWSGVLKGGKHPFPAYHISVQDDGKVVISRPLNQKGEHTWGRNTGNVGISMLGHPDDGFPAIQVEVTALVCAEVARKYKLDLEDTIESVRKQRHGDQLVTVSGVIHAPVLADHAWYAHADGYYPERWDCGKWTAIVARKARWYYNELASLRRKPQHIK